MLAALLERRPVDDPVALVVAHPDDETLAVGGSLHLFRRLVLVHVTDGAPQHLPDAAREGFASPAAYAAARVRELEAALTLSGATIERVSFGIPDQEAADAIPIIAEALCRLDVATVLTHPFEGGHPDHDAVALAASWTGQTVYEFAGYHADGAGRMRTGRFLPHSPVLPLPPGEGRGEGSGAAARPAAALSCEALTPLFSRSRREREEYEGEVAIQLPPEDLTRKRAMLACFATQRDILSRFDPAVERFRPAPAYDFARPPSPDRLLYECWGWAGFDVWRRRCGA